MNAPIVFISYSHDSPEHRERVLGLSERLRADHIDAWLDQYEQGGPDQGWDRWMSDRLDAADSVLVVCTKTYYRRFRGHEEPGKGKGADWEGALITHALYKARSRTLKFVPVLFAAEDEEYIPEPLQGMSYYTLMSELGYEALRDFLLGQAGVEPGELGDSKVKPRRRRGTPLAFPDTPIRDDGSRVAVSRLPRAAGRLLGREKELARLSEAWKDPDTRVVSIVAWGGVGKTSLVAHWQADLSGRDYEGGRYFDWSFYSQGTREQDGASADQFIAKALEFFGDPAMAQSGASPWEKGERLARLVAAERTLLVLDGLEPLQHPPGSPLAGELRDPAVAVLLKGLAQRNPGLCVVTTRERVADLSLYLDRTVSEWTLEHLATPAGVRLLETLGVAGSAAELEGLVRDVAGHALTLNLFGSFLKRAHGGDIRRRDHVTFEKADVAVQGGHAFKVMAAYERWLAAAGEAGQRQLAVLRLLGLFDRPADATCLAALRQPPVIAGLTEPLAGLEEDDADWRLTVSALEECGLLSTHAEVSSAPEAGARPAALDAHPLIREYFAARLREKNETGWSEAHGRLYDHLAASVEYHPDTLGGLQPLYQAVAHACLAGRAQEACEVVYHDRIRRGEEDYSTKQLGAFGADLGAAACFFERPWRTVSPALTERVQAWLLSNAAFCLRALGRLAEAREPTRAGLERYVQQEYWTGAAIAASNLSQLELALGEVAAALRDAAQAVRHADQSSAAFERLSKRAGLADSLHQAGRREEALESFSEAEAMQAESQPGYPLLYSMQGFQYCGLLLAAPERAAWLGGAGADATAIRRGPLIENCIQVERRAARTLAWVTPRNWLLSIALDHLTLGCAAFYRAQLEAGGAHAGAAVPSSSSGCSPTGGEVAREHLAVAVDGLRRAGVQEYLARGLLARAWLRSAEGDADGGYADLVEIWQLAERGPMPLVQADVHLHRARLFHAVTPYPWESAQQDLKAARALIERCGYWRRKEELEDAEAAARNW